MPVPSQEKEQSFSLCVKGIDFVFVPAIFQWIWNWKYFFSPFYSFCWNQRIKLTLNPRLNSNTYLRSYSTQDNIVSGNSREHNYISHKTKLALLYNLWVHLRVFVNHFTYFILSCVLLLFLLSYWTNSLYHCTYYDA